MGRRAPAPQTPASQAPASAIDAEAVLNAIADAVIVVDGGDVIRYANHAAEEFFQASAAVLLGTDLGALMLRDSPLFAQLAQVRRVGAGVTDAAVTLESPRIGSHVVTVKSAPLAEAADAVVVTLHEHSLARRIGRQLSHRNVGRSVTAMAAMLAHEVKNPLSGIRGAAQLLEDTVHDDDRVLTRLICDEADRIVGLVDRMEVFSEGQPVARAPVNIHEVLEHVRRIAQSGFAAHVRFVEAYDPSLPAVYGDRDQLIQVLLNLVKNAAEAVPEEGGEIGLTTQFRHGLRLAVPGSDNRVELPLVVVVRDNGPGIPDDLRAHLFDPFVTTKPNGSGLGLALVAKIIGDHGGVIDVDSEPRRTEFQLLLPQSPKPEAAP